MVCVRLSLQWLSVETLDYMGYGWGCQKSEGISHTIWWFHLLPSGDTNSQNITAPSQWFFHEAELLFRLLPLAGMVVFCGHATGCVMLRCFQLKSQTANRKLWVMIIRCHNLPSWVREIGWSEAAQMALKYHRMSFVWNNSEDLFWLFWKSWLQASYDSQDDVKSIGQVGASDNV